MAPLSGAECSGSAAAEIHVAVHVSFRAGRPAVPEKAWRLRLRRRLPLRFRKPKGKPLRCSSWRLLRKRRKQKPLPSKAPLPGADLSRPAVAGIPVPGASPPCPQHRWATPHFCRRVGWTARRQIPSLDGFLTGGHVFRARCRRNPRGRGFRSASKSARVQSYTFPPCRLAQRAARR
jgi:hypothetical protein